MGTRGSPVRSFVPRKATGSPMINCNCIQMRKALANAVSRFTDIYIYGIIWDNMDIYGIIWI